MDLIATPVILTALETALFNNSESPGYLFKIAREGNTAARQEHFHWMSLPTLREISNGYIFCIERIKNPFSVFTLATLTIPSLPGCTSTILAKDRLIFFGYCNVLA